MKKTFIVLILITLTLTAVIETLPPVVKAQASTSDVTILSFSYYTVPPNTPTIASSVGDLIVVGEVRNVGSITISNVTLEGAALSSGGQVLATTETEAFVFDMAPGQKAPFYMDFTAQSSTAGDLSWTSEVSNVSLSVIAVTDTAAVQYQGIKIVSNPINSLYDPQGGTYTVSATIENAGTQAVAEAWAVVTYYDASGTVVGVNFTQYLIPYPSLLEPGAYSLFEAVPSDCDAALASKISNFTVLVDSQTSSQITNPQNTPTPTVTTTNSNTAFPVLPIIVAVVLIVAAVLGLLLFRKRQKTSRPLLPPPPPPE